MEYEAKNPTKKEECIFCQTSINDQRPNLRVKKNNIIMKGLLDTSLNITIITPESWHSNWPLQEACFILINWSHMSSKISTR